MSVATHLGIRVDEYDARIRTFIPDYEDMLDTAAAALPRSTRTLVDLGTGTGALAARCLTSAPRARLVGIPVRHRDEAYRRMRSCKPRAQRSDPAAADDRQADVPCCHALLHLADRAHRFLVSRGRTVSLNLGTRKR